MQINSMFQGNTPQYTLNIDRDKVEMQGLTLSSVFSALSYYMGSAYVNDFVEFGRIYQVKLGAQAGARAHIDDDDETERAKPGTVAWFRFLRLHRSRRRWD